MVVLGGFNRRYNIAGDDMWADLDGDPDLTKHTEGLTSACMNFRFQAQPRGQFEQALARLD